MVHSEYMLESTQANLPRAKFQFCSRSRDVNRRSVSQRIYSERLRENPKLQRNRLSLELDRRTVKKYVDLADTEAEGERKV